MAKTLFKTYALWLFGGWLGLHHFYLGRDRHGLVWIFTLGGCFGVGWLRDFFHIPDYANDNPNYIVELEHINRRRRPPFNIFRFFGEIIVGMLFGFVVKMAVPDLLEEHDQYMDVYIPTAVTVGVWLVGGIGREHIFFFPTAIGSFIGILLYPKSITSIAICTTLFVNCFDGRYWTLQRQKQPGSQRLVHVSACILLYTYLLYSSFYYNHNGWTITADRNMAKLSRTLEDYFNSPAWTETKRTLGLFLTQLTELQRFLFSLDPGEEVPPHWLLGVSTRATEREITDAYRRLVRVWHPDKHLHPEMKRKAAAKFIKIQEAYNTLIRIKTQQAQYNSRRRWNDEM